MKMRSRVAKVFHDAGSRIRSGVSAGWIWFVKGGWIWVFTGTVTLCIPIGVLVHVMRRGHETQFPPSDPHTGFHPNPDTRGTINIISMCLLTIFSCVYVVVHPNVEETDMTTQTGLALLALFVPECLFIAALSDFLPTRRCGGLMRSRGFSQWTMTHAFAAQMGCFTIENGEDTLVLSDSKTFYDWISRNANAATHTFDYDGILRELKDRSKQNSLAKAFVALQALKVAVQVLARAAQSLPVTELELTTCAYIVCTLATYVAWWHKPYCIHEHVALKLKPVTHWQDQKLDSGSETTGRGEDTEGQSLLPADHHNSLDSGFSGGSTKREDILVALATACFAFIVGGIHAVAWNAKFINTNCQILWRICCLVHFICPIFTILALASQWGPLDMGRGCISNLVFVICIPLYVLSRILLFMLIGISFWSQPVDVYVEVKWLSFIPQWS